jgi:hypothetical protein
MNFHPSTIAPNACIAHLNGISLALQQRLQAIDTEKIVICVRNTSEFQRVLDLRFESWEDIENLA